MQMKIFNLQLFSDKFKLFVSFYLNLNYKDNTHFIVLKYLYIVISA